MDSGRTTHAQWPPATEREASGAYHARPWRDGGGDGSSGLSPPWCSPGSAWARCWRCSASPPGTGARRCWTRPSATAPTRRSSAAVTGQRLTRPRITSRVGTLAVQPLVLPFRFIPILGRQLRAADQLNENAAEALGDRRATRSARSAEMSEGPSPQGEDRLELLAASGESSTTSHRRLRRSTSPRTRRSSVPSTTCGRPSPEAGGGGRRAGPRVVGARLAPRPARRPAPTSCSAPTTPRCGRGRACSSLPPRSRPMAVASPSATCDLPTASSWTTGVDTPEELAQNFPWLDHRQGLPQPRALAAVRAVGRDRVAHVAQVPDGGEVDGVLAVDAEALARVMKVVGPVTVNGTTYTAADGPGPAAQRAIPPVPEGSGRAHRPAG